MHWIPFGKNGNSVKSRSVFALRAKHSIETKLPFVINLNVQKEKEIKTLDRYQITLCFKLNRFHLPYITINFIYRRIQVEWKSSLYMIILIITYYYLLSIVFIIYLCPLHQYILSTCKMFHNTLERNYH